DPSVAARMLLYIMISEAGVRPSRVVRAGTGAVALIRIRRALEKHAAGACAMKLIDSTSSPGSKLGGGMKTGSGDDRYAFDEAGEWACVIDGATDVGPVRVFSRGESDAAYFADVFASLVMRDPPKMNE